MRVSSYPTLPTWRQWKKDSAIGNWRGPYRRADKTLVRIDRMVKSLNKPQDAGAYAYKLGGLFFTTLYWNNNNKFDPKMEAGRRPAIMRLNLFAINKLAAAHECGVGLIAAKLREIYGVAMSEHGVITDGPNGQDGNYLKLEARERCRVIFRSGVAYKFDPKLASNPTMILALLDESLFEEDSNFRYGIGFVMSMSHELFVAGFRGGKYQVNFHSSIMGGQSVLCAGMLDVKQGYISRIKNDSGHYKPVDGALAKVLRHLKTIGVDISKIIVEQEQKGVKISGDKFLSTNGNWDNILKSSATLGHSPGCQCKVCQGKGLGEIS